MGTRPLSHALAAARVAVLVAAAWAASGAASPLALLHADGHTMRAIAVTEYSAPTRHAASTSNAPARGVPEAASAQPWQGAAQGADTDESVAGTRLTATASEAVASAVPEDSTSTAMAVQKRMQALARELRCVVCQNQSLAESDAPLAVTLRAQITRLVRSGASDEAVRDYLTERYGEFVLYRPRLGPRTWVLWLGPALLAVSALGALAWALRRRAQASAARFDEDV